MCTDHFVTARGVMWGEERLEYCLLQVKSSKIFSLVLNVMTYSICVAGSRFAHPKRCERELQDRTGDDEWDAFRETIVTSETSACMIVFFSLYVRLLYRIYARKYPEVHAVPCSWMGKISAAFCSIWCCRCCWCLTMFVTLE